MFFPQAGMNWILQPSHHIERSCAPVFFNPLACMSFSATSFHVFSVSLSSNYQLQTFLPRFELFSIYKPSPLFKNSHHSSNRTKIVCLKHGYIFLEKQCYLINEPQRPFTHLISNILDRLHTSSIQVLIILASFYKEVVLNIVLHLLTRTHEMIIAAIYFFFPPFTRCV